MTTSVLLAFLLVALVGGLLLMAVVAAPKKRGRTHSSGRSGHRSGGPTMNRAAITERWSVIEAMAAGGGNGLRQAVSEGDKLLDQALRGAGVSGDTLGERLKYARPKFSDYSIYDGAWRAHKLRNALAHEVGFDLLASQANEALRDFKRAIKDLGGM